MLAARRWTTLAGEPFPPLASMILRPLPTQCILEHVTLGVFSPFLIAFQFVSQDDLS